MPLPTYSEFRCDPDDGDNGAPGLSVGLAEFLYSPTAYEHPLSSPGGIVGGPARKHDSGLLARPQLPCNDSCDPWTGEPLPSTFQASFPKAGSFGCWCAGQVSRGMSGGVTVDG